MSQNQYTLNFPLVPSDCKGLSQEILERNARRLSESIISGLSTAPRLSPSAPCVYVLAYFLNRMGDYARELAERSSVEESYIYRTKFGKLLEAMVTFANSVWTPEQSETFINCECQNHERPDVQNFHSSMTATVPDSYSPISDVISSVFSVIAELAEDISSHRKDVIKLERHPAQREKWPSSPSKFIPHGPKTTVAAFVAWARVVSANPSPLHALVSLTAICPSLESAMSENTELLPLVAFLFSRFVKSIQRIPSEESSIMRRHSIMENINSFFYIFNLEWFQTFTRTIQFDRPITAPLATIYDSLCVFIPMIDRCLLPDGQEHLYKDRFRRTAANIQFSILHDLPSEPLHPHFLPDPEENELPHVRISELCMKVITLLNQPECASPNCTETGESTKSNFSRCAECHAVRYCSKACQRADWPAHKTVCKTLKALLPIAFDYKIVENLEPSQEGELMQKFCGALRDAGLKNEDFPPLKAYIYSHIRHGYIGFTPMI